jgi:hypothetical protein
MIPGVLPAYITVEAYHAKLARLAANAARAETPGVVRAQGSGGLVNEPISVVGRLC